MKYMGSKARWAKDILPIVLDGRSCELYVEPFLGGANTFHLVHGPKWGNDTNESVVAMLLAVSQGWEPPDAVSELEYLQARTMPNGALRGFIGVGCSYSGKFFGGYARGGDARGNPRNYCLESKRNLLRQRGGLIGARYTTVPYWEMDIPDGSIIYCDPPYAGATGYSDSFDTEKFWEWCASRSLRNRVYVSEFTAPQGWECIWSAGRCTSLTKQTGSRRATERLFRYVKNGCGD